MLCTGSFFPLIYVDLTSRGTGSREPIECGAGAEIIRPAPGMQNHIKFYSFKITVKFCL
jgi:hypothetical protein